jgi:hypothetical protein
VLKRQCWTILRVIVLLGIPLFISHATFANNQDDCLAKAIASGKNVVIIFVSDEEQIRMHDSTVDGEADFYGDWVHYLNSFLNDQGPKVTVCKMSLQVGRKLFDSANTPKDEWSISFAKKGRQVLYSGEPIMEPDIFAFVGEFFEGKESKTEAKRLGFSYHDVVVH